MINDKMLKLFKRYTGYSVCGVLRFVEHCINVVERVSLFAHPMLYYSIAQCYCYCEHHIRNCTTNKMICSSEFHEAI